MTSLVALLLAGCSENSFSTLEKNEAVPDPDIQVDPTLLEFSELRTDAEEVLSFTITNVGDNQLHVLDLTVDGEAFTLLAPETEFFLDIAATSDVAIAFTPKVAYENLGVATVFSDDPDEPTVEVQLEGLGAVPQLEITPDPLDFGNTLVTCVDEQGLTLSNIGQEPLVIDDISIQTSTGALYLLDTTIKPVELDSGESTAVGIRFAPLVAGPHQSVVTVVSNDPRGDLSASQTGEGVYASDAEDTFQVPPETADQFVVPDEVTDAFVAPYRIDEQFIAPDEPPVDILFAVDQSCSMDQVTVPLANAFSDFINTLNTVTTGWNIGVVTNDDGCFNSGVLTASTPGYESLFNNAVNSGGCASGAPYCDTEALLKLTSTALSQTGGCNYGFLRSGALLHIILVSDEKEQSGTYWSTWLTGYQGYVSDPSLLKVSSIVDYNKYWNDGCGDDGIDGGAAGYTEPANSTGGEVLDVCTSDWSQKTQDLALASVTAVDQYSLGQVASSSSIEVWVDGTAWTSGWYYDSSTNAVVFTTDLDGGEVIDVSYYAYGANTTYPLSGTPNPASIEVYVDGVQWSTGWSYDSTTNSIVFTTELSGGSTIEVVYVDASALASFQLSATPNPSSIAVSVDGYPWANYWSYDSAANEIEFSVTLSPGSVVDVVYVDANALAAFVLSGTPDPASLEVFVDGVQWTTGWTWDPSTNEIVFDTAPGPGSTIEVQYGVIGTCP